jgi:hypothetical protein
MPDLLDGLFYLGIVLIAAGLAVGAIGGIWWAVDGRRRDEPAADLQDDDTGVCLDVPSWMKTRPSPCVDPYVAQSWPALPPVPPEYVEHGIERLQNFLKEIA